jgi:aminopeptidase Y
LEIFLQIYRTQLNKRLKNRLRFTWFSGEEYGLLGSVHYNKLLQQNLQEKAKHVAYLNQDMLGSSNGVPIIRNGLTAYNETLKLPSFKISQLYATFFNSSYTSGTIYHENFVWGQIMTGEDQHSFLTYGIPAAGVANGAGSLKTVEEKQRFGGLAKIPYDPCYHKPCDDLDNVNMDLLRVLSKSAAYAVEFLGTQDNVREWLWSQ